MKQYNYEISFYGKTISSEAIADCRKTAVEMICEEHGCLPTDIVHLTLELSTLPRNFYPENA